MRRVCDALGKNRHKMCVAWAGLGRERRLGAL